LDSWTLEQLNAVRKTDKAVRKTAKTVSVRKTDKAVRKIAGSKEDRQ
jgi:hypothetical protein